VKIRVVDSKTITAICAISLYASRILLRGILIQWSSGWRVQLVDWRCDVKIRVVDSKVLLLSVKQEPFNTVEYIGSMRVKINGVSLFRLLGDISREGPDQVLIGLKCRCSTGILEVRRAQIQV